MKTNRVLFSYQRIYLLSVALQYLCRPWGFASSSYYRDRIIWKTLLYSNMISKGKEAARMTTVNCCGRALCCTVGPHPIEWGMTQQAVQLYTLYIELKLKSPHLLLCASSHSVSHYYKEWWTKNQQLPLSLVSICCSRVLGTVRIVVTCRVNEHFHPVL